MFDLFLAEQLNRFAGFGIGLVRWDSLCKNVIQQQLVQEGKHSSLEVLRMNA